MPTEIRRTWCGLCHARCGLLMDFEGARALAVRGDPDHPGNQGRTCARGRMMLEHLYHPDRLNHPLRRVGERGSGQWQRAGWDEALDEVAARLVALRDRHGPETLAMSRGTWRTYHWDARRFMNLFGSPNMTGANPICHCPTVIMDTALMGAMPYPDLARSRCVVIWGSCRSQSSQVIEWHALYAAKKRGARVITVDPRRTREADLSDLWLQLRPGTDAAMMLGWIHVICEEGLWDRAFVDQWTHGFDEIRALARDFTPAEVSRLTWVTEEKIVQAARLYSTTRPSVITWGQGVDKIGSNAEAAMQARTVLRAITGNLDVPGGECFGGSARPMQVVSELALELNDALPAEQRAKQLGGDRHRLFSYGAWERLAAAVSRLPADHLRPPPTGEVVTAHPHDTYGAMLTGEPYPVRALIVQAANPPLTLADPARIFRALRALDLLVVMDYYLTPTAALADFVFPAACTVERDDLTVFSSGIIAHPRALSPLEERRPDYDLWMGLGRRLGQEAHWPWDTVTQVCDYRLAPIRLTFQKLAKRYALFERPAPGRSRELGFGTPSGKVELRSSVLADLGAAPLPRHRPGPEPSADFPLLLITGSAFQPMHHSEQRQWPTARKKCPDPIVSLHPETAATLGIAEGDWVLVSTPQGTIRQRARLSDRIHPRLADAQHGWWFPEREIAPDAPFDALASNANVLCSDSPEHCSPGMGSWAQTGLPCRIAREG